MLYTIEPISLEQHLQRVASCEVIQAAANKRGILTAEIQDEHGFHELTVRPDGTLLFAAYAGDKVPLETKLEGLPQATLQALAAACFLTH